VLDMKVSLDEAGIVNRLGFHGIDDLLQPLRAPRDGPCFRS
jgi:hypothetical protein